MKVSFLPAINLAVLDLPFPLEDFTESLYSVSDACPCANYKSLAHAPMLDFFVYGTPLDSLVVDSLLELRYEDRNVFVRKVGWKAPLDCQGRLLLSPDAFRFLTFEEPSDRTIKNVSYRCVQA